MEGSQREGLAVLLNIRSTKNKNNAGSCTRVEDQGCRYDVMVGFGVGTGDRREPIAKSTIHGYLSSM